MMSRLNPKDGLVTGRWRSLRFVPSDLPFLLRGKRQVGSFLLFLRSRIFIYLCLESFVPWLGYFNVAKMSIYQKAPLLLETWREERYISAHGFRDLSPGLSRPAARQSTMADQCRTVVHWLVASRQGARGREDKANPPRACPQGFTPYIWASALLLMAPQ